MPRRKLPEATRGIIIGRHLEGRPGAQIGAQMKIPKETVRGVIQRYQKDGRIASAPRSGRPRKLSKRDERALVRESKLSPAHRRQPLADLQASFPVAASTRTLSRTLARSGIKKWRAAEKPGLTEEHAQLRKEWAERYAGWTVDDWRKVVWSDECSVARSADPRKGWVFHTREE